MVSVPVVAPEYGATLVTLLQVVPPLVLTCHWYTWLDPLPAPVKLAVLFAQAVAFVGWVVTVAGAITVSVTQFEFAAGAHVPLATSLYP
jgi:uncharacterized protein (DUF486 family)